MFFERHEGGERVVLVQLALDHGELGQNPQEFEELVRSAGGEPVAFVTGHRRSPTAS
jgi:GTP-binding protein HflX